MKTVKLGVVAMNEQESLRKQILSDVLGLEEGEGFVADAALMIPRESRFG